MKYVSTRGAAPELDFEEVLLAGLARDGGLYVPEHWPAVSPEEIRALAGAPYTEIALAVLRPFVGDGPLAADLKAVVEETYAGFDHAAVTPLKQLDQRTWLLELFHGPTLAFKDVALQLVGRLFDRVLAVRDERITIVGATSGDTGSAAIEACRDRERIEIYILHPQDRVSPVQRRQMTTVDAANVHNIAIQGTFDDCQDLLKGMFNDQVFRDQMGLSAVNSINWARIMAQIVYYFAAAVALGAPERAVAFTVPTGNFGNVFAGYGAKRMGLPISQLIVGSNRNDILTRFFETGTMAGAEVQPTLSPSMDSGGGPDHGNLPADRHLFGERRRLTPGARALRRPPTGRRRDPARDRAAPSGDRRADRPSHRDRDRGWPGQGARRGNTVGGPGDRPSGQVSRRGGAGHRRAPVPTAAPIRPLRAGGAAGAAAQ
jgi:threonine synthase